MVVRGMGAEGTTGLLSLLIREGILAKGVPSAHILGRGGGETWRQKPIEGRQQKEI